MSTILKALKQVDQTAPPEDIQSWPPKIDTIKTVKARVEKIRLNRKVYLTIVLVLILVAAGWLVYSQKDLLLTKLSSGRILEKDQLTSSASSENGPVYQAKIYTPASKQTASSPKKDSLPNMGNRRAGLKYEPKQTGTDSQSRQLPKTPVRKNIVKNQNLTISNKTGSPTKKAKSLLKPVSRSYKRLDDSKLKLQAIAWSNDVAQRIAVINGHIVREGESVEGFSVTQIRQDDIIVNDGTESWRLEFGLK